MKPVLSLGMLVLSLVAGVASGGEPEFGGQCAMSMTKGDAVTTDCSVFWVSPDDKTYCFANEAARAEFLKTPVANLQKAKAFWDDPAFWERFNRQKQN